MDTLFTIPTIALYAETHFKFFSLFPSLLFKREPELFFDLPRRVRRGAPLPVLLLLNDIDRFPVTIERVAITISHHGQTTLAFSTDAPAPFRISHPFSFQSDAYLFSVDTASLATGTIQVNCSARLRYRGRTVDHLNDNLSYSSKLPFTCTIVEMDFPGSKLASYGDLHVHSQHSRSHVEFGPPISIIDLFAQATGLAFVAITDHSYDLACSVEDYLAADRENRNWTTLKHEIFENQAPHKCCLLLGEEISVHNSHKQTVHLGAIGIHEYIPGNSDGARRRQPRASLSIHDASERIKAQHGVSFAAHPGARSGFLQRMLLKRGMWSSRDIHANLTAFQAANNGFTKSWLRGKHLWVGKLLSGFHLCLVAGNDTHGDFNRYRAIKTPFLSIYEDPDRYLGAVRTGIYRSGILTPAIVLDAISNGETFITSGPFLGIATDDSGCRSLISNAMHPQSVTDFFVIAQSSDEFGAITRLKVFQGIHGSVHETLIYDTAYSENELVVTQRVILEQPRNPGYIRAECSSSLPDGTVSQAFTSPCYLA